VSPDVTRAARPLRVVIFGGAYFEPNALRFVVRVADHPQIEVLAILCQGTGRGFRHRVANLVRRRKLLAAPILALDAGRAFTRLLRNPVTERVFQSRASAVTARTEVVADIHAPDVIARVRRLAPDLGLIYGAPILRPELFTIPTHGTLGIHHGRVPDYRGKKTTFWAMYNGEAAAGVTIQRVNAGLDTGEILREGEVRIGNKGYRRVEEEIEALGIRLYIEAILEVGSGVAEFRQQPPAAYPLYRQPSATDFMRMWWMRLGGRRPGARRA
jgi:methionyl-tRNA formyltransferase